MFLPLFDPMFSLTLDEKQAESLASVLDFATKSGGIELAKHTVPLFDMLMKSIQETKEQASKEQTESVAQETIVNE